MHSLCFLWNFPIQYFFIMNVKSDRFPVRIPLNRASLLENEFRNLYMFYGYRYYASMDHFFSAISFLI